MSTPGAKDCRLPVRFVGGMPSGEAARGNQQAGQGSFSKAIYWPRNEVAPGGGMTTGRDFGWSWMGKMQDRCDVPIAMSITGQYMQSIPGKCYGYCAKLRVEAGGCRGGIWEDCRGMRKASLLFSIDISYDFQDVGVRLDAVGCAEI